MLQTEPGAAYTICTLCDEVVAILINIEVELLEGGENIRARVVSINQQPMYDHHFEKHILE